MPASSIVVNGRTTRRPNVYSQIDATSMQTSGPGVYSLVLIGDAIGGKPASAFAAGELPFLSATSPDEVASIFQGGDLRAAGLLAFSASNDAKVPNGPSRILFYKTNNSTQASGALKGVGSSGLTNALFINSIDYSARANQISVAVQDGASSGTFKVLVRNPSTTEAFDNLGSEPALTLSRSSSAAFDALRVNVGASSLQGTASLNVDFNDLAPLDVAAAARIGSVSNPLSLHLDAQQPFGLTVQVFGLDADGNTASEQLVFEADSAAPLTLDTVRQVSGLKTLSEFKGTLSVQNTSNDVICQTTGALQNFLREGGAQVTLEGGTGGIATITGFLSNGSVHQEEVSLSGNNTSVAQFTSLTSVEFSEAQTTAVTISDASTLSDIAIISAGVTTWGAGPSVGLVDLSDLVFDGGNVTLALDAVAETNGTLVLRGFNAAGDLLVSKKNIAAGDIGVVFDASFAQITQLEGLLFSSSDTPDSDTLQSGALSFAMFDLDVTDGSLADLVAHLSALNGLTAATARDASNTIDADLLDYANISLSSAAPSANFFAVNYDIAQALNGSQLVRVVARSVPRVKPSKGAVTLSGGSDYGFDGGGVAHTSSQTSDFLAAFTALQDVKNVIIVPLSHDSAVHAALSQHCRYMEGVGRDERNGYVALPLSLNKQEIKARIRSLNNRNISAVAQSVKAYNELGELQSYSSIFCAVLAAAMQAGSAIGMPLTNKIINIQDLSQNSDWAPSRSAEEMLEMGLMFARFDQERGFVWERSITTSRENNAAFTEMSTNESINVSTKTARAAVENRIGDRLFAGLAGVIKSLIVAELQGQIENGIIKSYNPKSISVRDIGDGFDVSYEIAPLEPVNFIRITAHIKRAPVSA